MREEQTRRFLESLRAQDVKLRAQDGKLRCNAPKGVLTDDVRAELALHKANLLTILEKEDSATPALKPVPRDGSLPLSFGQERLWFLQQMEPEGITYNCSMSYPLEGVLDDAALQRAVDRLFERHEVLRTTYRSQGGQVEQVIHPPSAVPIRILDLRSVTVEQRRTLSQRCLETELQVPLDLAAGPVAKVFLWKVNDKLSIIHFVLHHIATDGWSLARMVQEVQLLYQQETGGAAANLPKLTLQYADYAAWQRQWLRGEELERQMSYWRKQLQGAPALLALPTDRPRPAVQTFGGRYLPFQLGAALTQQIKEFSRSQGVTVFAVLLAGFKALLAKYSGQDDIVVGISNGTRPKVELESVLGFFVNTQALRSRFAEDPNFQTLCKHVGRVVLEALDHQDVPFEKLVEELQPVRDLSTSPIFQVLFVMHNSPLESLSKNVNQDLMASEASREDTTEVGTAKFDLSLYAVESERGLGGYFEFNTDLFDIETIDEMAHRYQTLLTMALENSGQPLSQISMLSERDRDRLLNRWNRTAAEYPKVTVPELFRESAAGHADKIAVETDGVRLTYRELDEQSDAVAASLGQKGVQAGELVGLCMNRSPRMVVAMLGILKSGAAYVPMDPGFPVERLKYMLEDSEARFLVTEEALRDFLGNHRCETLVVGEPAESTADLASTGPGDPEHPAYVIYTSGSTGRPKGVVVPHRSVANFLNSMRKRPGLTSDDVLLAVTTLSFDISVLEILLPLTTGATVVLATSEVSSDGEALQSLLQQSGATVMQATPATWELVTQSGWKNGRGLKVLCGGEALSEELAIRILDCGVDSLWNMYGPTETTVWSTVDQRTTESGTMSIGRPIDNTQVLILDESGQLAPSGIAGEIHIGGDGLTLGYWKRPELTEERFVPHPFAEAPAKLYRTGDVGRFLRDGSIEYLGRMDHQVKLRGFRIELGEIEALLREHPGVQNAVVIAREDRPGDKRLVGYLVPEAVAAPSVPELKSFLETRLPSYMVPSAFVTLQEFPLTPNGKIDRKSLPAPTIQRAVDDTYEAPQSELEKSLATLWQEVLQVDRVGLHDNFFDLGGHSLLLLRVHHRLGELSTQQISMVEMFQYPTVDKLARRLSAPARASTSTAEKDQARAAKSKSAMNRYQQRAKAARSGIGK